MANKCDLRDQRTVTTEEGMKLAKEHHMMYMETSAESNYNITEVHLTTSTVRFHFGKGGCHLGEGYNFGEGVIL